MGETEVGRRAGTRAGWLSTGRSRTGSAKEHFDVRSARPGSVVEEGEAKGLMVVEEIERAQRRFEERREADKRASRPLARSVGISHDQPRWEESLQALPVAEGDRRVAMHRDALFRRALAAADVFSAYAALSLGVLVVGRQPLTLHLTALLIAPLVVLASKTVGLYDRDQHVVRKSTIDEVPKLFHLAILYALAVWLGEDLILQGRLARAEVFGIALVMLALLALTRTLARNTAMRSSPEERCLVIGTQADARRTADKLATASGVRAMVVGRVAVDRDDRVRGESLPLLGGLGDLAAVVLHNDVDRAIIAPNSQEDEQTLSAIRLLKALGVRVSVLPRLLEVVGSSSTFDEVNGITLLGVRQYGLSASSELLKRVIDTCVAALSLLLLAPLFALIALAIKLDDGGPIFFRQARIGRRGEVFDMVKFRSMVVEAESIKHQLRHENEAGDGLFKITDDPRITRVGRVLRKASLDELPQLINVFGGAMSLVGPRPLVPDEDALIEGWQRRRLSLRPGMTGLWQIFGSARIPMAEMVKIDYLYGANWSLWLDLKVLLRTIPYVLAQRGQ